MAQIECQGCGYALDVPASVSEGGEFACSNCGLILLNVEAARAFRWIHLDAYTREHGASRVNLWGGLIGAAIWLPIFAAVAIARDEFRPLMLLALAAPYVGLLALLFRRRARTPAAVWVKYVWTGLGAYGLYLWLLFTLVPDWWRIFEAVGGKQPPPVVLGMGGAGLIAYSLLSVVAYRRRVARLPKATGVPPRA